MNLTQRKQMGELKPLPGNIKIKGKEIAVIHSQKTISS